MLTWPTKYPLTHPPHNLKRWLPYVAASLIMHVFILGLSQTKVQLQNPILSDPKITVTFLPLPQPKPKNFNNPKPNTKSNTPKSNDQKLTARPKQPVDTPIQIQPKKEMQKSIMFENSTKPESWLKPSKSRIVASPTQPTANETAKKNLSDVAHQLTQMNNPQKRKRFGLTEHVLETAKDGAAFYAATSAGNLPAMIAVAGLSLHSGALRHNFQKMKQKLSKSPTLTDLESSLLAQLAEMAPVTARDLYLATPSGWTYKQLKDKLDDWAKKNIVTRQGTGHDTRYAPR